MQLLRLSNNCKFIYINVFQLKNHQGFLNHLLLSIKFPISQLSPLVINKKLTFSFIKCKNEHEIIRDKVKNFFN